jgi:hypothetical protein
MEPMLLPPMPWPNYKNITDEDASAIFEYLKSTKPVEMWYWLSYQNEVPCRII